jgi:hypothetical protein
LFLNRKKNRWKKLLKKKNKLIICFIGNSRVFQETLAYDSGTLNKEADVNSQNSGSTLLSHVDEKMLGRCFSIVLPSGVIEKG